MAFWRLFLSQCSGREWSVCVCVHVDLHSAAFMNVEQPVANWKPSCTTLQHKGFFKVAPGRVSFQNGCTMMGFYLFCLSPLKGRHQKDSQELRQVHKQKMFHVCAVESFLFNKLSMARRLLGEWAESKTMNYFVQLMVRFTWELSCSSESVASVAALPCHRSRNSNLREWHVGKWVGKMSCKLIFGPVDKATEINSRKSLRTTLSSTN